MTTPTPRPWRKRLTQAAVVLLVLMVVAWFAIPPLLTPWLHAQVETEIAKQLNATGKIEEFSFSAWGGVTLGPAKFKTEDASLVLLWTKVESDLSPLSVLFASETLPLGDHLRVDGLTVRINTSEFLREAKSSTQTPAGSGTGAGSDTEAESEQERRLALPAISLTNAGFLWSQETTHVSLRNLSLDLAPSVVELDSKLAAGIGLTAATTVDVATAYHCVSGRDYASGRLDTKLHLTPNGEKLGYNAETKLRVGVAQKTGTPEETIEIKGGVFEVTAKHDGATRSELQADPALWSWLSQASVNGTISKSTVGTEVVASAATLSGSFNDDQWQLKLDPTTLNQGTIQGTATLADKNWTADLTAEDVVTAGRLIDVLARVSPVFAYIKKAPAEVACLVGVPRCTLRGSLDDFEGSLSGDGELSVSTGRIVLPQELKPVLGQLSSKDLEKLEFRPYRQKFRIERGRIENTGFGLASDAGSLWIEGYTTVDGQLHHTMRLDKIAAREGGGISDQMVLNLLKKNPVRLTGTVDEPRVILPPILDRLGGLLDGVLGGEKRSSGDEEKSGLEELIETGLELFRKK